MNWKATIIGAIVFWLVTMILGMFVTGIIIHEGILDPIYQANEHFFVEPLRQDPPDMAALLPVMIPLGILSALVVAGLYACVGKSFSGAGWLRGAKWGFGLSLLFTCMYLSMDVFFDLPTKMWVWWSIDAVILYVIGGAAMGWAMAKWGDA